MSKRECEISSCRLSLTCLVDGDELNFDFAGKVTRECLVAMRF